jgi:hypothetical protein
MSVKQYPCSRAMAATAIVLGAALAVGTNSAGARGGSQGSGASCTPKFVDGAMHLCGPAGATFRGFTYTKGTCKPGNPSRATRTFVLELGELHPGSPTNDKKPYFKIEIDGPFTNPTSGHVISWLRGTRWAGFGESFEPRFSSGKFVRGKFVVTRTATGADRKSGGFHC